MESWGGVTPACVGREIAEKKKRMLSPTPEDAGGRNLLPRWDLRGQVPGSQHLVGFLFVRHQIGGCQAESGGKSKLGKIMGSGIKKPRSPGGLRGCAVVQMRNQRRVTGSKEPVRLGLGDYTTSGWWGQSSPAPSDFRLRELPSARLPVPAAGSHPPWPPARGSEDRRHPSVAADAGGSER